MGLKSWGVPPFKPEPVSQKDVNKSSRSIGSGTTDTPRYRLEVDKPIDLLLGSTAPDNFDWYTFTNTGRYAIKKLKMYIDSPWFKIRGGVPKELKPGESFKVEIRFQPKEDGVYLSLLHAKHSEGVFYFDVKGKFVNGLLYDGSAAYNGRYAFY